MMVGGYKEELVVVVVSKEITGPIFQRGQDKYGWFSVSYKLD